MMKPSPAPRVTLLWTAMLRLVAGIFLAGMLIFIPAGTLKYWQAWVFAGVLFAPLGVFGCVLLFRDPGLLGRRMSMRESQAEQKQAIAGLSLLLMLILAIPGFDRRYGWSSVPPALVLAADCAILLGYVLFALTVRENRFASRVVEIQPAQVVISSGPYALVRHPMYLSTTLIFILAPLALGSYWGMLASIFFPALLAARIHNEEQVLREGLEGYDEYTRKVRYRLIPFLW